jgi:hypothetical protein
MVVLLIAAGSRGAPATTQAAERTFTSTKYKVRFQIPGSMEYYKPDVKGMVAQYRATSAGGDERAPLELIQLMVVDNGRELHENDLDTVVAGMRQNAEKAGGKVIAVEASKLGGSAARDFTYTRDLGEKVVALKQTVAIHDSKAYVLGFVAEQGKLDDFLKRAQVARDSFEWLP